MGKYRWSSARVPSKDPCPAIPILCVGVVVIEDGTLKESQEQAHRSALERIHRSAPTCSVREDLQRTNLPAGKCSRWDFSCYLLGGFFISQGLYPFPSRFPLFALLFFRRLFKETSLFDLPEKPLALELSLQDLERLFDIIAIDPDNQNISSPSDASLWPVATPIASP